MTNKSGFSVDSSDFDKKFAEITKNVIPELGAKGLFAGGNELLRDAIVESPQAPFLKGDLRGSRIVIAPTGATSGKREPGVKVETSSSSGKDITVQVGFNIEYATRQHEAEPGEFNYTISSKVTRPGPKFLETKMVKNKNKYMAITAETIKAGGK